MPSCLAMQWYLCVQGLCILIPEGRILIHESSFLNVGRYDIEVCLLTLNKDYVYMSLLAPIASTLFWL